MILELVFRNFLRLQVRLKFSALKFGNEPDQSVGSDSRIQRVRELLQFVVFYVEENDLWQVSDGEAQILAKLLA